MPNDTEVTPQRPLEVNVGYHGDTPPSAPEQIAALEAEIVRLKDPNRKPDEAPKPPLRLDLGCGPRCHEGFVGVDIRPGKGIQVVVDLARNRWPWPDNSVDEVICSHMFEHVPRRFRSHFVNELHRVLKPGAKAAVVTPAWSNVRAYGDITHEWPPVTEMFWAYLDKEWRTENAVYLNDVFEIDGHMCPPFLCDFKASTHGFSANRRITEPVNGRNEEYREKTVRFAVENYINAAEDMLTTLTKGGG